VLRKRNEGAIYDFRTFETVSLVFILVKILSVTPISALSAGTKLMFSVLLCCIGKISPYLPMCAKYTIRAT